jgi:hypothetical protein
MKEADPVSSEQGVVVVRGAFTPGSIVKLVKVPSEVQTRAEGGEVVEERMVDKDANVGFAGLAVGDRFFVTGYVDGVPVEKRARACLEGENSAELAQPSPRPIPARLGTEGKAQQPPVVPDDPGIPVGVATEETKATKRSVKKK